MIEKMEKLYIYSLKEQTTDIMEDILKCGAVQITEAQSMLPEDKAKILAPGKGLDISKEEILLEQLQGSISVLKGFGSKKGLFSKRPEISYEALMEEGILFDTMQTCEEIKGIIDNINELKKSLKREEFRKASYSPWKSFDIAAEDMETESCKVSCYILQEPRSADDIKLVADEKSLGLYTETVYTEQENQYVAVAYLRKDEKKVKEAISIFGAREVNTQDMSGTFGENIAAAEKKIADIEKAIAEREEQLKAMAVKREELERASDAVKVRIQCLSGQEDFMGTDMVDIITGWIPVSEKDRLMKRLKKYECCCEFEKPEKNEEFPVLMKNSKLVEPFGAITEMYSLPASHSIDTNWAIGLFFFIFFGMMLSDAGYGLLLLIGGFGGAKLLDIGDGAKRFLKMIGTCGISTMFWGFVYGSFFGDAIPKIAETFFGKSFEMPMLIDPLNEPMTVLILACALGVVHLFVGMGIKAYILIKQGHVWSAVFDVGFWYIFLIGLPLLLAPAPFNTIGKIMAIAGAAGLVLTQGRHKPTVIGKITSGVMSLYDVTSYFSDVLSYSRILALGLATGVVGSVVNIMGTMAGGNIIGVILFIVIFAAGHMLNLGINALGAYVHSARLQYVEFFGKYYEGGGKKFDPLKIKTKYVKVTEEK